MNSNIKRRKSVALSAGRRGGSRGGEIQDRALAHVIQKKKTSEDSPVAVVLGRHRCPRAALGEHRRRKGKLIEGPGTILFQKTA